MTEEAKIGQFLSAHGGPFYTLQQQLGLLHEDAFRAGTRTVVRWTEKPIVGMTVQ